MQWLGLLHYLLREKQKVGTNSWLFVFGFFAAEECWGKKKPAWLTGHFSSIWT